MNKPSRQEVLDALADFQRLRDLMDPDKAYRKRKFNDLDLSRVQEAFNHYLKLNKLFHDGQYCRFSDSSALQGSGDDRTL